MGLVCPDQMGQNGTKQDKKRQFRQMTEQEQEELVTLKTAAELAVKNSSPQDLYMMTLVVCVCC